MQDIHRQRVYHGALLAAFVLHVLHGISLPILATYDGAEYLRLADVLGSPNFSAEWDFGRTPLYPALLKLSGWALGRQALAAQAPGLLLGFLGVWCVGASLRRLGHPVWAALGLMALSFYPTLVTYEHTILTESGSFFFLALLLNVLTWQPASGKLKTGALVLVLIAAYYFRPTFLYLAPVVALLQAGPLWLQTWRSRRAGDVGGKAAYLPGAGHLAAVVLLPWVAAYPWNCALAASPRKDFAGEQMLFGLAKQAVIPPGHSVLGAQARAYEEAIHASLADSHLPLAGVDTARLWPIWVALAANHRAEGGRIFREIACANPLRYVKGVVRTTLYFGGVSAHSDENRGFTNAVITTAADGSKVYCFTHPLENVLKERLYQKTGRSLVGRVLNRLIPFYDLMILAGVISTLVVFCIGLRRMDARVLAFAALPLAHSAMFVLILLSADRYAFPAYPIALANLCVLPCWVRWNRAGPRVREAQAPAGAI